MHIAKYQASALGRMCGHYERSFTRLGYERDNIDPGRSEGNYNLAPNHEGSQVEFINERIRSLNLKRSPRKDAVRMCDCVVTLPSSFDRKRANDFFCAAYDCLKDKFGEENVISAWVHVDETTPHMHYAWVPVTKDGRLSAKDVLNRNMLKRFHGEIQADMERILGCQCEILLDDETRGVRSAKYVDMQEFQEATERLERLRRDGDEIAQRIRGIEKTIAAEHNRISEETDAKEAFFGSHRTGEIEEASRAYEAQNRKLRARGDAIEGRVQQLRSRISELHMAVSHVSQGRLDRVPLYLRERAQKTIKKIKGSAARLEALTRQHERIETISRGRAR